jgi:hypothetical protein
LLSAPATLPFYGLRFILQQIADMAERELLDEERVREDLLLLQLRLEEGEIEESEYAEQESLLIARLRAVRQYREQAEG